MAPGTEVKGFFYMDRGIVAEIRELTTAAMKVFLVQAGFMHKGERCFVDAGDLAEFCDMPLGKVEKAIYELIRKGWIERTREPAHDGFPAFNGFKLLKWVRFGERSQDPENAITSMRS